ncbi:MAG: tetratricopeptide repeat protein [Cyclobacteriaceae bacterium]
MPKKLLFFIFHFLIVFGSYAQLNLSQSEENLLLTQGKELILGGKYNAARTHFDRLVKQFPERSVTQQAAYYQALAALKAGHSDGLFLGESYFEKYQVNPEESGLNEQLALYYFDQGDYRKAASYFGNSPSSGSSEEMTFKRGYTAYQQNKNKEALSYFNRISDGFSDYAYSAAYYGGFIEYDQGGYVAARQSLEKAAKSETYAAKTKPLLAIIYYQSGNSTKLMQLADELRSSDENASSVYLLAGEVQYTAKEYAKAVDYFEKGLKAKSGKSLELKYKLGYAYLQLGNADKAIDYFKEVALSKSDMGHHAAYYLGELYVQQSNLSYASSAFYNASRLDFDPDLATAALFYYGKTSFQLGNYQEAIDALIEFEEKNPTHPDREEANELVSKAFLATNDYDVAINYIEKIERRSAAINATYQRVTFRKGTDLFNKSQFFEAVRYFDKSIGVPVDKALLDEVYFWKGEAYSIGKKYEEAIVAYRALIRNNATTIYDTKALYAAGYAYYNLKNYADAKRNFELYIKAEGTAAINASTFIDARLRLADCNYARKDYDEAITGYSRVANSKFALRDYARYQLAQCLWMADRPSEALTQLNRFFEDYGQSTYADDAYFLTAQINFETGSYQQAVTGYSRLINAFPQSNLVPYALVRRAISYANLSNTSQTEQDYKRVLSEYPRHPMAENAILGLQEVMSASGQSGAFSSFLSGYKEQNPESTNLESVEFESAKSLYFSQDYSGAIAGLQAFISNYENSNFIDEAQYYLADANYRLDRIEEALIVFNRILTDQTNTYFLRSLSRVAQIDFRLGSYQRAITNYRQLFELARSNRERNDALSGLMESYFQLANYDSTAYYANELIAQKQTAFGTQSKAYLYLGKSAQATQQYEDAIDHYLNVLNLAKDENGAEAQYNMAEIQYQQGEYRQSLQSLYNLNTSFASYEEWLGKSFLLITDNFIALDELFQAEATLNSVIEKSPLESIKTQARAKLKYLEGLEKEVISDSTSIKQDSIK